MAVEFDRRALLEAFGDLGRLAWADGNTVEIAVYGGSALMLSYDWRAATKDVDGVYAADREVVRALAARVAMARGWPADWLNDGVKGFLSPRDGEAGMKNLSGEFPWSEIKDAYLAAVAEHLATSHGLDVPAWCERHGRRLQRAFFAGGLESLKATLTVESPAAFRRRLLFVSKNALDRPRMDAQR